MIRLEAFVDDKKVAKVLHALDGLVIQMTVGPVHNAKTKGKKVVGAGNPVTGREAIAKAVANAIEAKQDTVARKQIMEIGRAWGINDAALSSALQKSVGVKLLKPKGGGIYIINKQAIGV